MGHCCSRSGGVVSVRRGFEWLVLKWLGDKSTVEDRQRRVLTVEPGVGLGVRRVPGDPTASLPSWVGPTPERE